MTIALAVLAGAAAAGWLIPVPLRRLDLRRRDPLLMIVAWLVSMVGVLLAATAGVLLLLLPGHVPAATVLTALHGCWSALQHGSPPRVEEAAGVLGLGLLAAFTARAGYVAARGVRRRKRARQERLALLRLTGRREAGSPDTLWLAHERPLAFSVTGRRGVIVATDGLTRHLTGPAVEAVLAHERAHLAGRHHLLIAAADVLRSALPFVPLFRHAPSAIRELVELAGDDVSKGFWEGEHLQVEDFGDTCADSGRLLIVSLKGSYGGEAWRSTPDHPFRLIVVGDWGPVGSPGEQPNADCSAHFFDPMPGVGDGNILVQTFYGQGTRFIDFSDPRHPVQVGYFYPKDSEAAAPAYHDGLVYTAQYSGGIDVLRFTPPRR